MEYEIQPITGFLHILLTEINLLQSMILFSSMKCSTRGVSRISLGPLIFLLCINDLHDAIVLSSSFHFPDDTYILNKQNSVDKIKLSRKT